MNDDLKGFARQYLLDGLQQLPIEWQEKFKLMYGRNNGKRSVNNAKLMDIESVIDEIPDEKLDWAMQQISNSLKKAGFA